MISTLPPSHKHIPLHPHPHPLLYSTTADSLAWTKLKMLRTVSRSVSQSVSQSDSQTVSQGVSESVRE